MKVGFFADDGAALRAAILAAHALRASVDDPEAGCEIWAGGPSARLRHLPGVLGTATERGSDVVLALPLASLQDVPIRCRLDLAVVVLGPTPFAALRAAQAAAEDGALHGRAPPAWLLVCGGRALDAADEGTARKIPIAMPRLAAADARRLRLGAPTPAIAEAAAALATALLVAAADPFAPAIRADHVAGAMGEVGGRRDQELRRRLRAIAAHLGEGCCADTAPDGPRDPSIPGLRAGIRSWADRRSPSRRAPAIRDTRVVARRSAS